jgi:hypothetical protein
MPGIQERLHGRFTEAIFPGMGPALIVLRQPSIQVRLQVLKLVIEPLSKCHAVKLILDGAMETLADTVGLR